MKLPPDITDRYWFDAIASHLGPAYWNPDTGRVAAFTKGTEQEVDFLVGALALEPGMRVLDVGCGPGRHSLALARRGIEVVGVDHSAEFVRLGREAADGRGPGRDLRGARRARPRPFDGEFDVAICLCQGGFGLLGGRDETDVFGRIARTLRPGGALAVSAFSAAFAVRHLEDGGGVRPRHRCAPRAGDGPRTPAAIEQQFDLWTTCFTARELELLAAGAGLGGRSRSTA